MKLLVIGEAVILASRNEEKIGETVNVIVDGAIEGATLNLIPDGDGAQLGSIISSGTTTIRREDMIGESELEETYSVTVTWSENNVQKEAYGARIRVYKNSDDTYGILPPPLTEATDLEDMWHGIINTLEVIVPFIETYKYGADAL